MIQSKLKPEERVNHCDFCSKNLAISFGNRLYGIINGFAIVQTQHPWHEFHLLIFDTTEHVEHLHEYSNIRTINLKNLINLLDIEFNTELSGYQGYNLASNNGEYSIGQHVRHAHLHLFMRFKNEKHSPFDKQDTNNTEPRDMDRYASITNSVVKKISLLV